MEKKKLSREPKEGDLRFKCYQCTPDLTLILTVIRPCCTAEQGIVRELLLWIIILSGVIIPGEIIADLDTPCRFKALRL